MSEKGYKNKNDDGWRYREVSWGPIENVGWHPGRLKKAAAIVAGTLTLGGGVFGANAIQDRNEKREEATEKESRINAEISAANGELAGSLRELGDVSRELGSAARDAGLVSDDMGVHVPHYHTGNSSKSEAEQQSSANELELYNLADSHDRLRRELGMPEFGVGADFSGTNGKPTVINWEITEESDLPGKVADTLERHRQAADDLSLGYEGIAIYLKQSGAEVDANEIRARLQGALPDEDAFSQRTGEIRKMGQPGEEQGTAAERRESDTKREVERLTNPSPGHPVAFADMDAPVSPGQGAGAGGGQVASASSGNPAIKAPQRQGATTKPA